MGPTGIPSPDRPSRSESLYQLRYRGRRKIKCKSDERPVHRDLVFVKWRHFDERPVRRDLVFVKWRHFDERPVYRGLVFLKWRHCDERPVHRDLVFVK